MPELQLNEAAVRKAEDLIRSRQYVLESTWPERNPTAEAETAYLDRHGWEAYGAWHLGLDPGADPETKGRFSFPYGDFRRVHRSGLIAARQRASQYGHRDVEEAAGALLELLDEARASAS